MTAPPSFDIRRRLVAEALGTALLLAIGIGSGVMGERLSGGNVAIALLGNTLATGAGLVVLITILGPISGAHFNPAVSLAFALRRELSPGLALAYSAAQVLGGLAGVVVAHASGRFGSGRILRRLLWGSTSPRPTGSRPRHPSPTLR